MSKIKLGTVVKLCCSGVIAALTVALCITPLAPLGICIAVCTVIVWGCEIQELVYSHQSHPHTDNIESQLSDTHHINSQSKGSGEELETNIQSVIEENSRERSDIHNTHLQDVGDNIALLGNYITETSV